MQIYTPETHNTQTHHQNLIETHTTITHWNPHHENWLKRTQKHNQDVVSQQSGHTCFGCEVNTEGSDGVFRRVSVQLSHQQVIVLHPQRKLLDIWVNEKTQESAMTESPEANSILLLCPVRAALIETSPVLNTVIGPLVPM